MNAELIPTPREVLDEVSQFIYDCHHQAAKYSNVDLLDESQTYSLVLLAGRIYQAGFYAGAMWQSGVADAQRTASDARKDRADA